MKLIASNKKAHFDFFIHDSFEAGIVLKGSEAAALRQGRANLKDSFVRIIRGEAFLLNAHISYLKTTNAFFRHEERGARKLLLHKKQLDKLQGLVSQGGFSIVALKLYYNSKNIAKLQIALAKGKKLHDKREVLKAKQQNKEAQMAMKNIKTYA